MPSPAVSGLREAPPLCLYVHLPWCERKCPYCDFNSHQLAPADLPQQRYVDALVRDLDHELPRIGTRQITSIFFGGGTPSLFSAEVLGNFLGAVRARLDLSTELEITLEANPGSAEARRFSAYREAGINRLSIGVQSFDDRKLASLGRIHDAADARAAVAMAQQAGFDNINIDLMFALPGQTPSEALVDLETAVALAPTHISWYQLTIEANTVFYRHPPPLPTEDTAWEIQTRGQALLAANAYRQYEVSAYASGDRQCRHNLNYWRFGDYTGIGAGAHGKMTDHRENRIQRFARHRIPAAYMEKAGSAAVIAEQVVERDDEVILQFMMNALRLCEGFPPGLFSARTGLDFGRIEAGLESAVARGLLEVNEDAIRPTRRGFDYLNDLLAIFMPAG